MGANASRRRALQQENPNGSQLIDPDEPLMNRIPAETEHLSAAHSLSVSGVEMGNLSMQDANSDVLLFKSDVNLKKSSLKLKPGSSPGAFFLEFMFDCNCDVCVTIYYQAYEISNLQIQNKTSPIYLWCPQEEGGRCINRYYFGQGYKQRFPQVEEVIVADYLEEALTSYNQTYYPLAIKIEAVYPLRSRALTKEMAQITYAAFKIDGEEASVQVLKQKLIYGTDVLEMKDIYGTEEMRRSSEVNDTEHRNKELCIICMENMKDTLVLPCRHFVICKNCAQISRMQYQSCALCRTKITAFLHINIKDQHTITINQFLPFIHYLFRYIAHSLYILFNCMLGYISYFQHIQIECSVCRWNQFEYDKYFCVKNIRNDIQILCLFFLLPAIIRFDLQHGCISTLLFVIVYKSQFSKGVYRKMENVDVGIAERYTLFTVHNSTSIISTLESLNILERI